ncbi:MFS general substrate transporter [Annulohypoxylon maeteangense]|uniref:MFS general substrate transporter n=1 Tax=Annulohypoxylon maeteangense TaxID=1927788 RepID=UPI002007E221|nr:MFS general substrate transporter [Annulohypoxylon maeteangense]KAI0887874.1 MFS general substrate transporter [Annulohypoxylon maeteangense]
MDMAHTVADSNTSSTMKLGAEVATEPSLEQPATVEVKSESQTEYAYDRDYRFWTIIFALCTMQILCSLENTVVVTSLPTIVKQLGLGSSYIWVTNIFFLAASVVQPLTGQLAGLFGRRYVALFVVALYTLGSGLAGGANGPAMLIAGRAVQGAGSGGMTATMGIVISDLVPLRLRSSYQAILAITYAVGMAIGPVIGGAIVQDTTWRWVFYINLPVGGVSLALLWLFLRVKWDKETKVLDKLKRIDVAGNTLLVASTVSVLIALTWAGSEYPWSSYHILVPFIIGLAGLVGFFCLEGSTWVLEPVMPLRLFANRTSAIIYVNTFIVSLMNYWIFFFLPLFFQAVQLSTPSRSGVQILPITLIAVPGAAVGAVALSKWGRYKVLHIIGFALLAAGIGSFSVLTKDSSTAKWVCLQIPPSIGAGMVLDTLLPGFQAGVEEADSAAAVASWSFVRSFGNIWGVAIPGAIFNIYSSQYAADLIANPAAKASLQNGGAYSSATRDFVISFSEPTRSQIIETFTRAMSKVFLIGIAFPALAFVLSFVEREVKLRTVLETEFGLEEKKQVKTNEKV